MTLTGFLPLHQIYMYCFCSCFLPIFVHFLPLIYWSVRRRAKMPEILMTMVKLSKLRSFSHNISLFVTIFLFVYLCTRFLVCWLVAFNGFSYINCSYHHYSRVCCFPAWTEVGSVSLLRTIISFACPHHCTLFGSVIPRIVLAVICFFWGACVCVCVFVSLLAWLMFFRSFFVFCSLTDSPILFNAKSW